MSRRTDQPQGSHPGLCSGGHQKPAYGLLSQPVGSPLQKAAASEGSSPPRSATKLWLLQNLQPKSQTPRANPARAALQHTRHGELMQGTGHLGGERCLGLTEGAHTPSCLACGVGGLFPPSPRAGLAGSFSFTSMPLFSMGPSAQRRSEPPPGAALRAAHTGAPGSGAPRDPRAGLRGAAGSVLWQRVGGEKVFPPLGFCYAPCQEAFKRYG